MIDPEDRWLDHALREVLGESTEAGPDLSVAIRDAWSRGERRMAPRLVRGQRGLEPSAVEGESIAEPLRGEVDEAPVEPKRRPRPVRSRVSPWWVAAASVLAVAGGVVAWKGTRVLPQGDGSGSGSGPEAGPPSVAVAPTTGQPPTGARVQPSVSSPVVLVSSAPLRLADGGDVSGGIQWAPEVPLGSAAEVLGDVDVVLQFAGERVATVAPGTHFEWTAERDWRLALGALSLRAAQEPVTLRLPRGAALELDPGSEMRVHSRGDAEVRGIRHPGEWMDAAAPSAVGVLEVEVVYGSARWVAAATSLEATLEAGDDGSLWLFGPGGLREATPGQRDIAASVTRLQSIAGSPQGRWEALQGEYRDGVFAWLRDDPGLWALAESAVEGLLAPGAVPPYALAEIVDSLAVDQSQAAERRLRVAWLATPEAFSSDALVSMAERGAFEFVREVESYLEHSSDLAAPEALPIACYLALQGNDAGAEVLLAAWAASPLDEATPKTPEGIGAHVLVAVGLEALGESRPMQQLVGAYVQAAEGFVGAGNLEAAAGVVLWLKYAVEVSTAGSRVGSIGHWVQSQAAAGRVGELTATDLLEELEALRRR